MKVLQIAFCIFGVVTLSACANTWAGLKEDHARPQKYRTPSTTLSKTWEGIKDDPQDVSDWTHDRPSALEETIGPTPTGYAKKNRMTVLSPSEMENLSGMKKSDDGFVVNDNSPVWTDIGQIDTEHPPPFALSPRLLSLQSPASLPVEYNEDVSVFPVDGDAGPYPMLTSGDRDMVNDVAGKIARRIFFDYGSARMGAADRRGIQKLAENLGRASHNYGVSVVGHADKRVDGEDDPVRRKMINLAMAQKRADAVTSELDDAGVNPSWVMVVSRGDEMPNLKPGHRTQEAADRRVEIYVDER